MGKDLPCEGERSLAGEGGCEGSPGDHPSLR